MSIVKEATSIHVRLTFSVFVVDIFLEDLFSLSSISLNSLVFPIRWQLVDRKSEPTVLLTRGIFNLPHHIDVVWEQLAFDDAFSYTQRWKSKLAEVMASGIELLNFKLGIRLWNKVRHPNDSDTEDTTSYVGHPYWRLTFRFQSK